MIVLEHVLNIFIFRHIIDREMRKWGRRSFKGKIVKEKFHFRIIHDCLTFIIDGENSSFDRGIKKYLREMRKIIH